MGKIIIVIHNNAKILKKGHKPKNDPKQGFTNQKNYLKCGVTGWSPRSPLSFPQNLERKEGTIDRSKTQTITIIV